MTKNIGSIEERTNDYTIDELDGDQKALMHEEHRLGFFGQVVNFLSQTCFWGYNYLQCPTVLNSQECVYEQRTAILNYLYTKSDLTGQNFSYEEPNKKKDEFNKMSIKVKQWYQFFLNKKRS